MTWEAEDLVKNNPWYSYLKLNFDAGLIFHNQNGNNILIDIVTDEYAQRYGSGGVIDGNSDRLKLSLPDYIAEATENSSINEWDLGESIKLTNIQIFLRADGNSNSDNAQIRYLVRHQKDGNSDYKKTSSVQTSGKALARGFLPDNANTEQSAEVDIRELALQRISDEVLPLGNLSHFEHHKFNAPLVMEPSNSDRARVRPYVREILKVVPSGQQVFNYHANNFWEEGCTYTHRDVVTGKTSPLDEGNIQNIWVWGDGNNRQYLVHSQCFAGSLYVSHGSLVLFSESGFPQYKDITRDLFPEGEPDDGGPLGFWHVEDIKMPIVPIDERYLIIGSSATKHFGVIDTKKMQRIGKMIAAEKLDLLSDVRLSSDKAYLVTLYTDQTFQINRLSDGELIFSGAYIDNEIVVMLPDGRYDSSFEGAEAVQVQFEGLGGLHTIHQFRALLHRPGLANNVLHGRPVSPSPSMIGEPPLTTLQIDARKNNGRRRIKVTARAALGLNFIRLFLDGKLAEERQVSGSVQELNFEVDDPGGARWVTTIAVDRTGLASRPVTAPIPGKPEPRGTLRAVLVGVDEYSSNGPLSRLNAAVKDALSLRDAFASIKGKAYKNVATDLIVNGKATPDRILSSLEQSASASTPDDTLIFMFSGHGVDPKRLGRNGELTLALADTRITDLADTGIRWSQIATVLGESRGRVVVILDACQAGGAGQSTLARNDDIVQALLTRSGAPIIVLAASKGRELSYERKDKKGGYFTYALSSAITVDRNQTDKDANGLIDLGELYSSLKSKVSDTTKHEIGHSQTPWLARNSLIGNMTLF